ncbi:MAG: penicillin acylase family protein [Gammaproteobacteria bacterium]
MKRLLIRLTWLLLALIVAGVGGAWWTLRSAGQAQVDGEMTLPGLSAPVTVWRDELGMAYIRAANLPDLWRAQGFVTAQHRLFQLELFRATWRGELAATFGEAALRADIRMRVVGTRRNGERHAATLGRETRAMLQAYADGMNAYITRHADDHPLEPRLVGLPVRPWSVEDLVTVVHYVHYSQATNFKAEVVAQQLVDKLGDRAREVLPLTVNPDREGSAAQAAAPDPSPPMRLGLRWSDLPIAPDDLNHQGLGSNNWAVGPSRSASGRAVVANDPHLDSRILPGYWHPVGLFTPEVQAVGAALPGMPGILSGRTRQVAFGVTNAYGDVQDLYVETIDPADPQRYLDGGRSVPFDVVDETIRVKDAHAPGGQREHRLRIRFTKRGPVVSDHAGLGPGGDRVLVLRSTDAEVHGPALGYEGLLTAGDAAAFDREVRKIDLMTFNFVFGDAQGNIGHRASGAVPVRAGTDGSVPRLPPADGGDDWTGFIPKDRMPGMLNPPRAWVGTANHDTRERGYPWYYSNYVAPDYRYRRMSQVLGAARAMSVDDHFALMADDRNLQSDVLRGAIVDALRSDPAQRDLAALLADWDGVDRAEQAAPLVYQALYREIARGTFADDLGDELTRDMLGTWYFWQQRFDALVDRPDADWFDDVRTADRRETLADVIRAAASRARAELEAAHGKDVSTWRWGRAHELRFVSPLRRSGSAQAWLGGVAAPRGGSGETLDRGVYDFNRPYAVNYFASLKMVADFARPDRIEAVIAGGVSERHFQPHQNDQARLLLAGERRAWWLDPAKAEANARHTLRLTP